MEAMKRAAINRKLDVSSSRPAPAGGRERDPSYDHRAGCGMRNLDFKGESVAPRFMRMTTLS